jgi:hypothetical protein
MAKKLPAKIFVKWDYPPNDEAFLLADDQMFGLVDSGRNKKSLIGTYQLIETTEAEMVVSTSTPIKARRIAS